MLGSKIQQAEVFSVCQEQGQDRKKEPGWSFAAGADGLGEVVDDSREQGDTC